MAVRERSIGPLLFDDSAPLYPVSSVPSNLLDGVGFIVDPSSSEHHSPTVHMGVATSAWHDRYSWHMEGISDAELQVPAPQLPRSSNLSDITGGLWLQSMWASMVGHARQDFYHPLSAETGGPLAANKPVDFTDARSQQLDFASLDGWPIAGILKTKNTADFYRYAPSRRVQPSMRHLVTLTGHGSIAPLFQDGANMSDPMLPVNVSTAGFVVRFGTVSEWSRVVNGSILGSASPDQARSGIESAVARSLEMNHGLQLSSDSGPLHPVKLAGCLLRVHCELSLACDRPGQDWLASRCPDGDSVRTEVIRAIFKYGARSGPASIDSLIAMIRSANQNNATSNRQMPAVGPVPSASAPST